jgi:hypothetical protein
MTLPNPKKPHQSLMMLTALLMALLLASDSRATRPPLRGPVEASWYYDEGDTACGFHAAYGVANRTLPCRTRVQIAFRGRKVLATVDDRGPYVYPRLFDLDVATRRRLGYAGPCCVYYRVMR